MQQKPAAAAEPPRKAPAKTMLGMMSPFAAQPSDSPEPARPEPAAASAVVAPAQTAAPAPAAASSHKRTMLGMSPIALGLPGATGPATEPTGEAAKPAQAPGRLLTSTDDAPRTAAPKPQAAGGIGNRTMLGVVPPVMVQPAPEPNPAPAPARAEISPQSKRTMLGAVAPLAGLVAPAAPEPSAHEHEPHAAEPSARAAGAGAPRQRSFTPVSQSVPTFDEETPVIAPRGGGRGALYAVLGLLVAAILAGVALYLRSRGPKLSAHVAHVAAGDELVVEVPGSAPGAKVRFAGAERPLVAGRANFPLSADALKLGENALAIDLVEPDGSVDSSEIKLAVDYRVRTDLAALRADPPAVEIVVDALPGSRLTIDGQPVPLDARGHAVKSYPVPAQAGARFDIQPRYRLELPSGSPVEGTAGVSLPVTSMQIDKPGAEVTTDQALIELAGAVEADAEVLVEGRPIEVRDGRFLHRAELPQPGDYVLHVVARAPGKAPRVQELRLRRVTDLTLAAASFKADPSITYAKLMQNPLTYRGQNVAFDGRVYNVEVNAGRSLIQILVLNCPSSTRCPLWVDYPQATEATVDSWVRVLGTVTGEQQFKSKQGVVQSVPSVQAQYVLKLAR
ncbi:MAG: hypothetical protein QM778_02660 [Myxococcales bacterium]